MARTMAWIGTLAWLAATCAWAWGPEGHTAVGDVAAYYLTTNAQARVREILQGAEPGNFEVSSWPDAIRGNKEYESVYPENAKWHFVEFNATEKYDQIFKLELPADGEDVVNQVARWQKELATPGTNSARKLDALRFLVHFVADLHQPLHCAYRYGDMGGNMIPVHSFRGRHFSIDADATQERLPDLHSVWDEYMVYELMAGRDRAQFAADLVAGISPGQLRKWSQGQPLNWAIDSYWRARKEAYRWPDGTSLPFKWSRPGMDLTSENYIDARLPLVQEQLEKAGVRLARMLNAALDPEYVPPPPPDPAPAPIGETPAPSP